jgi:diguanylate cyclase (GGDEF)-like protein
MINLSQQMSSNFEINDKLQDIIQKWNNIDQLIRSLKTQIKQSNLERNSFIQSPKFQMFADIESKLEQLESAIFDNKKAEIELLEMNAKLHQVATTDGLTQVANRYCFDRYLQQEWQRSIRDRRPLSFILCDVDFFKQYNDHYGHQAGDECLQQVAQAIRKAVKRPADLVARYGGEEFVVILPETNQAGAIKVAERIQLELKKLQIPHAKSKVSDSVTLSLGLSSIIPSQVSSPDELVAEADAKLYEAKKSGRNCIKFREIKQNNHKKISITLRDMEPNQCTSIINWCFDAKSVISIGRSPDNDIIVKNPVVSRHHLKLRQVHDRWQLISFGLNGTYIEQKQVNQVVLEGGTVINLARCGPRIQIDLNPG